MGIITGNGTAVTGLGGAAGYGETALERADASAVRLDVSAVFGMGFAIGGGVAAANLYISTDGLISFGAPISGLPADPGALALPFIAPFLADVDTRLDGEGAESGAVWVDVDATQDVVSITWADVGFYRRNASLTNTVQLQLFDRGQGAFDAVLRYQSIEWTAGDLEGGWGGTGGSPAFIGYDLGTPAAPVTLAASGSETAQLALPRTLGNTGVAGLWVFAFGGTTPPPTTDTLFTATASADILTGGAGFDTVSYAGPAAVAVDLANPALNSGPATGDQFQSIEGVTGSAQGDRLSGNGGANHLDGGSGNDQLWGRDGADTLNGGAGDDVLDGGGGADLLQGGDGTDRVSYASATASIRLDLVTPTQNTGHAAGDTLTGIESIEGSPFADTLAGDSGINRLDGGAGADLLFGRGGADDLAGGSGDDTLSGGAGADTMSGGDGFDSASYTDATAAVVADLAGGASQGDAAGDRFSGIEALIGSGFADALSGDANANRLDGGAGHDTLSGRAGADRLFGGAGDDHLSGGTAADHLDGGDGYDTASYATAASGVGVDLAAATANTGEAAGDLITAMEALLGSAFADRLAGDAAANRIDGGAGDDTLTGRGGADSLFGGTGYDIASYANATAGLIVDLMAPTENRAESLGDVLIGIEGIAGGIWADDLRGDGLANRLEGGAGNDSLTGRDGHDTLAGQAGADRLSGDGGNDLLTGEDGNDTLIGGAGNDTLEGGAGTDNLTGGIGVDWVSFASASLAVTIDLTTPSQNKGAALGDTLAEIEGVIGSTHADHLRGGGLADLLAGGGGHDSLLGRVGADQLFGGAGDDTLDGGIGADLLDGGDGFDTASYASATAALRVDLALPALNLGAAAGDVFISIESVVGSGLADRLWGSALSDRLDGGAGNDQLDGRGGNDVLLGGAGNDTLTGGAGADSITGGDGFDWASYDTATAAVRVDLVAPAVNSADAAGDILTAIEVVFGTGFADTLAGDANANRLDGGAGADLLQGRDGADKLYGGIGSDTLEGGAGADILSGGDGFDFVSYENSISGLRVDLTAPKLNTAEAAGDVLTTIEGLIGSAFADDLRGSALSDHLSGGGGHDLLTGRTGNDKLLGGAGNDTLDGGLGADVLDGGGGYDWVSFASASAGQTLDLVTPTRNTSNAKGDSFVSVEAFLGSKLRDLLWGNAQANHFDGGAGNDLLDGRGGDDSLWGGLGNDSLVGGDGADWLQGGAGRDWLAGDAGNDRLMAGDGNDTLSGGAGENWLTGGLGADRFEKAGAGLDHITDCVAGQGDYLIYTVTGATRAQFGISFAVVAGDGTATAEAFVTHRPSGQVLWVITDGAALTDLNLRLGAVTYDLI